MPHDKRHTLVLSSTFTAEPVEAVLAYWCDALELDTAVQFTPYDQVFPQLLDPASELSCNTGGLNVVLLRVEDLSRDNPAEARGRVAELIGAVDAAAARCPAPILVVACPPSEDPASHAAHADAVQHLSDHWGHGGSVAFLSDTQILDRYPVDQPLDPQGSGPAHIPYSEEFFAAFASAIARHARMLITPPNKVIVLDCDNTLWGGVCAEEGAAGVTINAGHRAFHRALIKQQKAGALLCLCSKNSPEDVHETFDTRDDIDLDRSRHIVAERINWAPKSQNLAELAAELNLGLDSFLFIDDNPVECAEVRSALPTVLAVEAPADPAHLPDFVAHLWPFDRPDQTAEDAGRTELYRSEAERNRTRRDAPSFSAFLEGLELSVSIAPASEADLPRLAQLTRRTNQFNASPEPKSEQDLRRRSTEGDVLLTIRVEDRFGDYGLAGAVFGKASEEGLDIDGFFLSCRVLGRGVEHQIINRLANRDSDVGHASLSLRFQTSDRNEPIRRFLDEIPVTDRSEGDDGCTIYQIPGGVRIAPQGASGAASTPQAAGSPHKKSPARPISGRLETLARTPHELDTAAAILAEVKALRRRRPDISEAFSLPRPGLEHDIAALWEDVLAIETVGALDPFVELGGRSLHIAQVQAKLSSELGLEITLEELFGLPTIRSLVERIEGTAQRPRDRRNLSKALNKQPDIAVIGMALRVPGASNPEDFWQNLKNGVECISELDDAQLAAAGVDLDAVRNDPYYVRAKGVLPDIDLFDAAFFGILPKEAEIMDPQQRIFLELSHEALERAGYNSENYAGKIGVYAGAYLDTYLIANICRDSKFLEEWIPAIQVGALGTELGNDKDYLATRVAYKLNLRGPSMTLQTACSTSMVAIAQACQSLVTNQSDMALAGGITVTVPQEKGYSYQEGGILSPDGHCRAFDHRAAGTVFSNGGGAVLLKRLDDAIADGDHIYSVIRGYALNNDGGEKHSYTAPSIEGQSDVIRMAQQMAGVDPETITCVEAHGTGTSLGDPIEVAGLTQAFREGTDKNAFCAIGSIKPNIGHLDVASGVTAVSKMSLALQNGQIPPLINYESPNPKIDFPSSPFYINTELAEWQPAEGAPRRAGVSSFGVGGTNAHLVMEEAPTRRLLPSTRGEFLFPVSAKTATALDTGTCNLADWLTEHRSLAPDDTAFTLQVGRKAFAHRRFVVAASPEEAAAALTKPGLKSWQTKVADPPVVFMFPGQGAQKVGMAQELYRTEPFFREQINNCAELLKAEIGCDIRDVIFPPEDTDPDEAAAALKQTVVAQPAIFVIENALARLWMHWGVKPTAMIGHSVGEFAAACIAGVFSLEEGLKLLAARGRLMGDLPGGGMLSVRASEETLVGYLTEGLDLAAVNGPELCVAAGPDDLLSELAARLDADGITAKALHTSHAFHSWMMDPVIDPFVEVLEGIELKAPEIPIFSTVTNAELDASQATDPSYWARHLRNPVRFHGALQHFWDKSDHVLLEVGPGNTLATLARQNPDRKAAQPVFASSAHAASDESDSAAFLQTLGGLWASGVAIDWEGYYAYEKRGRVPLPTYPFERKRFWKDMPAIGAAAVAVPAVAAATPISEPPKTMPQTPDRTAALEGRIKEELSELSGFEPEDLDPTATFLELGFDSLLLTQVSKAFENAFGIKVTLRDLLDEHPSIAAMTAHFDTHLDPSLFAAPDPIPDLTPNLTPNLPPTPTTEQPAPQQQPQMPYPQMPMQMPQMQQMPQQMQPQMPFYPQWPQMGMPDPNAQMGALAQQVQALSEQVAALASSPAPAATPAPAPTPAPVAKAAAPEPKRIISKPSEIVTPKAFGPGLSIDRSVDTSLTDRQQKHIANLVSRYTQKTARSKELTQQYRHCYADPRTASGFNRQWKEMCYQIVVEKSKGSRLLDRDNNEYIDLLNGFGPGFLGHSPDFIVDALHSQIDCGFEVGPQSPIAGEVAELFCQLTGNERASFVNTGSEAVQAAMRLARTVTGRDKIALFAKDYHGNFDEVLVRSVGSGDKARSLPSAPGIPSRAVEDIIVLPYGTDEALEVIRANADSLAAVLVEPVQSRRPEFQPIDFVRELREITADSGTLLVFDEVITGFRTGLGGAQSWFGVDADLATYGKVIGGGMPIGVVAGKAEYMDTFDGGNWQYGDSSFPEKPVTFFAGTFVRHPLAMASAKATLEFFRDADPGLWDGLRSKADRLAGSVDTFFADNDIPIRMPNFGSQMFVRVADEEKYANLLFFHLREKGVFLLETFPSYMTIAHSDAEIDYVIDAFKESTAELQDAGFFAGSKAIADRPKLPPGGPPRKLDAPVETSPSRAVAPLPVPTTEAQKEVLLASRISPAASCAFNEPAVLRIKGKLDAEALQRSLNTVLSRHDALRSRFPDGGENFIVDSEAELPLPVEDLSPMDPEARVAALDAAGANESEKPFDLEAGNLVRARLFKLEDESHVLLITAHHIVCDGWSFSVLVDELGQLYTADTSGIELEIEPAPQFAEHARSAKREGQSESHSRARDFWLGKYEGVVAESGIPTDRPRPQMESYRGDVVRAQISADVVERLRKAGAAHGATLYATFVTAFEALLHRLSGDRDIVLGIPYAGQMEQRWERLVGHCVHFLPLRLAVDPAAPFAEHLSATRNDLMEAVDHRQFGYGELLHQLAGTGRAPRVDFVCNVDRMEPGKGFDCLDVSFDEGTRLFCNYTLFANMVQRPDGLDMYWQFNSERLDRSTVERWIGHFENLLRAAGNDPTLPMGNLPLISEIQQSEALHGFNPQSQPAAPQASIQSLFAEQAAASPDQVAIVNATASITYADLDRLSDSAASRLVEADVAPGDRVALYLHRSPELIVSLLGILKAGAAYVPVDPDYPSERIATMLADAGAKTVVTSPDLAPLLPQSLTNVIDALAPAFSAPPAGDFAAHKGEREDCAYVIFTSGSTGKPKGVAVPHRGVIRLVKNTDFADLGPEQVFLQAAALSFDASTLEIWAPLLNGGRLALLPPGTPTPNRIAEALAEFDVTTLWLTAGLFQLMIDECPGALRGLKQLLAGGDVLSLPHVRKAFVELPDCRLINGYGPTENTTFTTCHTVTATDLESESVPIGKAIPGSQVYILDESLQPVPPGVAGELYTGGDGLALGYLGDLERTAEKFVDNPLPGTPGDKLYRTGDLCRFRPDGSIEFVGRRDGQVKIRGFRIERGEIEHALNAQPQVARSAVAVRGESADEKTLAAYVVPSNGFIDLDSLRAELKRSLPPYLVPESITPIESLPLNPSGKIDYASLPAPDDTIAPERGYQAPNSEIETQLQGVWQDLFGKEPVGVEDDFFELGGHSLLGLRLITRIEKDFDRSLPLASLVETPTIRGLSRRITSSTDEEDTSAANIFQIQPGEPDTPPLFAVHGGDGGALFYRSLLPGIGQEQPIYGIESPLLRSATLDAIPADVESLAANYIKQIRPTANGRYRLAGYSFGGVVAYEMARQLLVAGEQVDFLGLYDTFNPAVDPRPYTLAERVAINWQSEKTGFAGKIGKLGGRVATGLSERKKRNAVTSEAQAMLDQNVAARDSELRRYQLNEISTRLMEAYDPPTYPGKITLFKAEVPDDKYQYTELLGWEDLAEGGIEIVPVPGQHLTIFDEENAERLAKATREALPERSPLPALSNPTDA